MADEKAFDWGKLDVGGAAASQPSRETVVVHCANGHRLVVPAAMAGKWGKCAKCHVAFQIPAPGESAGAATAEPPSQQAAVGQPAPVVEQPSVKAFDGQPDTSAGIATQPAASPAPDDVPSPSFEEPVDPVGNPEAPARERLAKPDVSIGGLVMRLWQEVEHGGIVELHLEGGSMILPKWFEQRWSGGTHGLFASQAADGSVTLTAVAWDSIQKIVIRNVDGLPDGMFE